MLEKQPGVSRVFKTSSRACMPSSVYSSTSIKQQGMYIKTFGKYKMFMFSIFCIFFFSGNMSPHTLNANFSICSDYNHSSSLWMPQGNVSVMESTVSKQSLQFEKLKPPICCLWQCQLQRTELIKMHSVMLILCTKEEWEVCIKNLNMIDACHLIKTVSHT